MKTALLRITGEALAKALGVPGRVSHVFQDAADIMGDTVSLRVDGAGEEHREGVHARYWTIEGLIEAEELSREAKSKNDLSRTLSNVADKIIAREMEVERMPDFFDIHRT